MFRGSDGVIVGWVLTQRSPGSAWAGSRPGLRNPASAPNHAKHVLTPALRTEWRGTGGLSTSGPRPRTLVRTPQCHPAAASFMAFSPAASRPPSSSLQFLAPPSGFVGLVDSLVEVDEAYEGVAYAGIGLRRDRLLPLFHPLVAFPARAVRLRRICSDAAGPPRTDSC